MYFRILLFLSISFPAFGQIIDIEDVRGADGDSTLWYETADFSASLISNGDRIVVLNGNVQLEFKQAGRTFLSLSQFNFVKAGGQQFVNQGAQHIRYVIETGNWYSHEVFSQIQYNEQTLIKIRALAGTGGRFRLLEKKDNSLYFGLAYMFEYNEETEQRNIFRDHRMSSYLSFSLRPVEHVRLSGTTYYQPIITNPDVFRITSKTTLILDFTKRLAFKSSFSISYDERKRANVPKTLYNWTNGIRLRM